MAEARALHVVQQRLVERARETGKSFVIWDVGLGAGANAVAVLEAFSEHAEGASVELHSFDETSAPLQFALHHADQLDYLSSHTDAMRALLRRGKVFHRRVAWRLHLGDFRALIQGASLTPPSAILYDPYSARANPGMWTLDHLRRLRGCLRDGTPCLLTNYTRSTAVRVTLLLAGFFVGRGDAIGEKDETTIAANKQDLLRVPLAPGWLSRVKSSSASAPLELGAIARPISAKELDALERHPQFAGQ